MGESEGGPLTLHVEGLTRSVGAVHLADIFSTYGEVSKCSVEKDKRTGLSKGFGYVEFTKREAAEIAQRYLDGAIIDGQVIKASIILINVDADRTHLGATNQEAEGPAIDQGAHLAVEDEAPLPVGRGLRAGGLLVAKARRDGDRDRGLAVEGGHSFEVGNPRGPGHRVRVLAPTARVQVRRPTTRGVRALAHEMNGDCRGRNPNLSIIVIPVRYREARDGRFHN
eukprot:CAMPEP_0172607926 /NCGR_PEP_ID=MMETSP1068-20121228/28052_1 /TAXON_ID=35684 /ORGANISM="Pseudopedinella elastica, Strain CCMP716" /LENGTH=224 /DNA_ID=CAMNT_0013411055 /DNA_START=51 /DNA_END=726 /DNA_ORIENTATION=-